jgi:uncharacterized protein (TIGR01777 family)
LVALSRLARASSNELARVPVRFFAWRPLDELPPAEALAGVEAVVHLAGENVAGRWTPERKRRIHDSRVLGTRNLIAGLRQCGAPPRVVISASAVGVYGNRGDEILTEHARPGQGFLADVCRAWEAEARQAEAFGARVVLLRTGVVLSTQGGALKTMLPAFQYGVAGKLGDGRQWFPWIHETGIVGLIVHALNSNQVSGPVNGAAPNPVTNEEFTKELAAVLNRPALLPVPKFALDLLFGEMAAVLLASQRVVPEAALAQGYQFAFPWLKPALEDLLGRH